MPDTWRLGLVATTSTGRAVERGRAARHERAAPPPGLPPAPAGPTGSARRSPRPGRPWPPPRGHRTARRRRDRGLRRRSPRRACPGRPSRRRLRVDPERDVVHRGPSAPRRSRKGVQLGSAQAPQRVRSAKQRGSSTHRARRSVSIRQPDHACCHPLAAVHGSEPRVQVRSVPGQHGSRPSHRRQRGDLSTEPAQPRVPGYGDRADRGTRGVEAAGRGRTTRRGAARRRCSSPTPGRRARPGRRRRCVGAPTAQTHHSPRPPPPGTRAPARASTQ